MILKSMHDKYKYTDYHKVIQLFDVWYIFTWLIPCCDGCYDFRIKRCSVRLYSQCFVGGFMSYLYIYFHLFMHSGGQHKRYLIRSRNCLSYAGIWDHPPFFFSTLFCVVQIVDCVPGLSILYCPFALLYGFVLPLPPYQNLL
jgi:hypothetical protein